MIKVFFDKLYRYPRVAEPCSVAVPFKKGELRSLDGIAVIQDGKALPVQPKVTSRHDDGSVR